MSNDAAVMMRVVVVAPVAPVAVAPVAEVAAPPMSASLVADLEPKCVHE